MWLLVRFTHEWLRLSRVTAKPLSKQATFPQYSIDMFVIGFASNSPPLFAAIQLFSKDWFDADDSDSTRDIIDVNAEV